MVLDGIDTRGRVCVDSVFLERVNARDGAPALQHAYAATSYQAQGATVDRAFVMADPSMDRQEFYVAASRSREETHFYATPEVRFEREEIAPEAPGRRKDLEHIAGAAERDGAQVAAHEQALRSKLAELPSPELYDRLDGLLAEIGAERRNEAAHLEYAERIGWFEKRADNALAGAERLDSLPRRQRRTEAERIVEQVEANERVAEQLKERQAELPEVGHQARAEAAVTRHLIAERERATLTALRVSPPDYITKELGERPSDPGKRQEWDRAVRGIERYRERQRRQRQGQRSGCASGGQNPTAEMGATATAVAAAALAAPPGHQYQEYAEGSAEPADLAKDAPSVRPRLVRHDGTVSALGPEKEVPGQLIYHDRARRPICVPLLKLLAPKPLIERHHATSQEGRGRYRASPI